MKNKSWSKSPMRIEKCIEWVIEVYLIFCWILGILGISSFCVGIHKWISTLR
jgi:hypothetical protein